METLIDTISCMVVESEGHSTTTLVLAVLVAITISSGVSYFIGVLLAVSSMNSQPVELDEEDDDGVWLGPKEDWHG